MWDQKAKTDFGAEEEAKAWKNLWSAGQGVATINDNPPAAELIATLKKDMVTAMQAQAERAAFYGK
jgi:nitronate monooxygenase